MSLLKKSLLNLLIIFFVFIVIIIIIEIILRSIPFVSTAKLTQPVDHTSKIQHLKPNNEIIYSTKWNGSDYIKHKTNNYGFNTSINFDEMKEANCLIGDSYIEAFHVKPEESIQGILNNKNYIVYAFGKSGSPLSTYLGYARFIVKNFNCKKIIFFLVDGDFIESFAKFTGHFYFDEAEKGNLNLIPYHPSIFDQFYTQFAIVNYLYKQSRVSYIKNFMRMFSNIKDHQIFYSEAKNFDYTHKISLAKKAVDIFIKEIQELNYNLSDITFVLDGDRYSIYAGNESRASGLLGDQGTSYNNDIFNYIISESSKNDINLLDLHPKFLSEYKNKKKKFNFNHDYHWNSYGHSFVATQIEKNNILYN